MKKKSIIFGSIALVIILVIVFANDIAAWYIDEKIQESKLNKQLEYSSLTVTLLKRKIALHDVKFTKNGIKISTEKFTLNGIDIFNYLKNNALTIRKASVKNGTIELNAENFTESDTTTNKNKKQEFWLKNIYVDKVDFLYSDSLKQQFHKLYGINLNIKDIAKSIYEEQNTGQIVQYLTDVKVDSMNSTAMKYHQLKSKTITFKDHRLKFSDINIEPIQTYRQGKNKPNVVVTWVNLQLPTIMAKINISQLEKKILEIEHLQLEELNTSLFTDQRLPKPEGYQSKMPHTILAAIQPLYTIKTVEIKKANIKYAEISTTSDDEGYVTFNKLSGTIKNLSNDSSYLAKNPNATAQISTKLMNQSTLEAYIDYDLTSAEGAHTIKASINNFELRALNTAFEPLAQLRFNSGMVETLDYHFNANNISAWGETEFRYQNLNIALLNSQQNKNLKNKITTLFANNLLVRKANPLRGNYVKGKIEYDRNSKKSFLNFWWKASFSGMKSTMIRTNQ